MSTDQAAAEWQVWSTTAQVVTEPAALPSARRILEGEIAAMDVACSRFRPDSDVSRANAAAGRPTHVSPLFIEALAVALLAAEQTDGAVDPTVGRHVAAAGYDRDLSHVASFRPNGPVPEPRPGGWRDVEIDLDAGTVTVPSGLAVDLGATAKALSSDHAAQRIADRLGVPVLVSLGGDIAIAGTERTDLFWVRVVERLSSDDGPVVLVGPGGLATSTTVARAWKVDGREMHHIVDPRTGVPADGRWRTATVAAGSCVAANTASTAVIVLGEAAVAWLEQAGLPARLVARDGAVLTVAGWPAENPE